MMPLAERPKRPKLRPYESEVVLILASTLRKGSEASKTTSPVECP